MRENNREYSYSAYAADLEEYDVTEDDIDLSISGKWMLFFDANTDEGQAEQDEAWLIIKELVENNYSDKTGIFKARSTNAWANREDIDEDSAKGVICCWTFDYRDKNFVEKAASSIREVYDYPRTMYYKTVEATNEKMYQHRGDMYISTYKHTTDDEMFERDECNPSEWNLIY